MHKVCTVAQDLQQRHTGPSPMVYLLHYKLGSNAKQTVSNIGGRTIFYPEGDYSVVSILCSR
jgi:hypothetical protein